MHYKKTSALSLRKQIPQKDWLVSHNMIDLAISSIISRITLNRKYDIPYLAGYSKSGKIIYIDRHMPRSFIYKGHVIKTDKYLILHEAVEKTLIDKLGLPYQFAHRIALRVEEAAVRADKVSWKAYDNFMQTYIKTIGDERVKRIPKNLDLKPYRDEHDNALLKSMRAKMC